MSFGIGDVLGTLSAVFALTTLYKQHLAAAAVDAHVGDGIGLTLHSDGRTNSVHLDCTFTNSGAQMGVLQKLVLMCTGPDKHRTRFNWELFYTYDGMSAKPSERPHSIVVAQKGSTFVHIQFNCEGDHDWIQGTHELELLGWCNIDCMEWPNVKKRFKVEIGEGEALLMENEDPPERGATIVPFPIKEALADHV